MSEHPPFLLEVNGHAEIPHTAERAFINVKIASRGPDKASVSSEVLKSVHKLEELLRSLSAKDSDPEDVRATAALAHWSKTSLSATSERVRENDGGQSKERLVYNASMSFDIRFREFKALGQFSAKISALPHVELSNINWALTPATKERFRSELRKKATEDAWRQARDYAEVFGYTNVRPLELSEGSGSSRGFGQNMAGRQHFLQTAARRMSGPGGFGSASDNEAPGALFGSAEQSAASPELEFTPQEIGMNWSVTIKFQAN